MADFILLNEDFSDFPIGEFPYDKNHSAMGEYHFIHYPGYYGNWYDPVCNHTYNGQGASWIISEYNGKHFMEQMRIRNDKPHRTFPMLTSGDSARTVPIALNYYMGTFANNYSALFAAVVMTVMPTILVFIILQRQVMESLTAGAVKG